MKPSLRDYLTVLLAFAAVLICGFGIGHLVGQRGKANPAAMPAWQEETLRKMHEKLALQPGQVAAVEAELAKTAGDIRKTNDGAMLEHLHHIDKLYERLIGVLETNQADRLRSEKKALEEEIEKRSH